MRPALLRSAADQEPLPPSRISSLFRLPASITNLATPISQSGKHLHEQLPIKIPNIRNIPKRKEVQQNKVRRKQVWRKYCSTKRSCKTPQTWPKPKLVFRNLFWSFSVSCGETISSPNLFSSSVVSLSLFWFGSVSSNGVCPARALNVGRHLPWHARLAFLSGPVKHRPHVCVLVVSRVLLPTLKPSTLGHFRFAGHRRPIPDPTIAAYWVGLRISGKLAARCRPLREVQTVRCLFSVLHNDKGTILRRLLIGVVFAESTRRR